MARQKNHQKISVIVPFFNEPRARQNLQIIEKTLAKSFPDFELICVEDGHNSHSVSSPSQYSKSKRVKFFSYPFNVGKGFALAYGFSQSTGQIVAFLDGDLDIHPKQLHLFADLMDLVHADIVIGSKRHPLSQVKYPFLRRLYSRVYQNLVRILFGLNVTDTQVGIKLFRRKVLKEVIPRLVVKAWAFDLEVLVVAHRLGYKRIIEAPVELKMRKFGSKVNLGVIRNMLIDTAAIFYRRFFLRYYDRPLNPSKRRKNHRSKKTK